MKRREFALIAAATCLVSFSTFGQSLPNLSSAAITHPNANVPQVFGRFVGKWGGYWSGDLASNLIIQSVTSTGDFQAVYAWGTSSYVPTPGTVNVIGRIDGDRVNWGDPYKGIGFVFAMLPDGTLQGTRWDHGVQRGSVVMRKM